MSTTVTLSKRMKALAKMVDEGMRLADVGCDHGYLPIYLLETGVIDDAIAMDVNQGPLDRAKKNIKEAESKGTIPKGSIETRLSDGFDNLHPGEADAILIAGMGGNLMIDIIKQKPAAAMMAEELILQPQSDVETVRRFLVKNGYEFLKEDMVEEDGKYYPMMKVHYTGNFDQDVPEATGHNKSLKQIFRRSTPKSATNKKWSDADYTYGKLLIDGRNPVLKKYLVRELGLKKDILHQMAEVTIANIDAKIEERKAMTPDEKVARLDERRKEIESRVKQIKDTLSHM